MESATPRTERSSRWSSEQREALSRIGKMRDEVHERLLRLERMRTMNKRMRPDDRSLLHDLAYAHPELISGDALGDVRQVLDGDHRARALALESIGELKDLIAAESNVYEDAGREESERETIIAARKQHLKVLMQEWDMQ